MAINFELRSISKRNNATANLYIVVRDYASQLNDNKVVKIPVNCKFKSDIEVHVAEYHAAFRKGASEQARNKYELSGEGKLTKSKKEKAVESIKNSLNEGITDAAVIAERVASVLLYKQAKDDAEQAKKNKNSMIIPYFTKLVGQMRNKEVKNSRKKDFDKSTIKYYDDTLRYLKNYLGSDSKLTFNQLNEDVADGFQNYMESYDEENDKQPLMQSTIRNIFACMRSVCGRAYKSGLLLPDKYAAVADLWKFPAPSSDELRAEIVLSQGEIDALYNLDMNVKDSKGHEVFNDLDRLTRDMALVGFLTLQRFSDFSRIDASMIKTINKRSYIVLQQEKTNTWVSIPYFGKLREVLERNNNSCVKYDKKKNKFVPKVCYSAFGYHLRKILKELSKTYFELDDEGNKVYTLQQEYVTNLTANEKRAEVGFKNLLKMESKGQIKTQSSEYYRLMHCRLMQLQNGGIGDNLFKRNAKGQIVRPKWSLANSHLCRRSAITNALYDGFLTDAQIRKLSGHKTIKAFKTYDHRDEQRINANIFDALQRAEKSAENNAEDNEGAKVVSMAM